MSAGLHGHVEALRTGDGGAKDAAVRALVEPAGTEKYANDREEHAANRMAIVAAGGIAPLVELARGGSAGAKGQAAGALLHVSAVGRLGREPVGPVLGDASRDSC